MSDGNEENKSQGSANKTGVDNAPQENELRNSTSYNEDDKPTSDSVGSTRSTSKSYDQRDAEFGFFYDLNKKMILKRIDVGGIYEFNISR